MVVWKGWGFLVVVFLVAAVVMVQFPLDDHYYKGFYKEQSWTVPLVFFLASIPSVLVGLKLNNKPARVLLDPETGEQVELKHTHSLFWIPMQYYGIILNGLAVLIYLRNTGVM